MRRSASVVASARPRDDQRNASIEARRDRSARLIASAAVRAVTQQGTQEPRDDVNEHEHPTPSGDTRLDAVPADALDPRPED